MTKKKKEHHIHGKERKQIELLKKELSDPEFLLKKNWIISYIRFKLQMIDMELSPVYHRSMIAKVESRIKTAESIRKKLIKKGYPITFENAISKLNDITGVRIVCLYCDDIFTIADYFKKQKDIHIIKEKDYIKNPKKSGYQSLHLIVEVPIIYMDQTEYQKAEIQIRSVAMDFWASVDNQMCYKKSLEEIGKAEEELKDYSDIISKIDRQMLELRKKVEKM